MSFRNLTGKLQMQNSSLNQIFPSYYYLNCQESTCFKKKKSYKYLRGKEKLLPKKGFSHKIRVFLIEKHR